MNLIIFFGFLGEFPETGTAIALLIADRLVLLSRRSAHARTVNVFTEILAANLASWDEPTLGQIVGDRLIYNAASGWPSFTNDGELVEGAVPQPIRIMSLPLD